MSLSCYYTLCFCIKQYNFHLLIYSQLPVVHHFTNWWHLPHFPWTIAFTRTFATLLLWCYNFNRMIKWYDISCVTLYIWGNAGYTSTVISDVICSLHTRLYKTNPTQYLIQQLLDITKYSKAYQKLIIFKVRDKWQLQNWFKLNIKGGLVWYIDRSKTSKYQQGTTLCSKCGAAKWLRKELHRRLEMVEVHESMWCHPTLLHSILQ